MKLSCLPVSFFPEITSGKMSVAEWARMGAELGLDAIDLSILFIPERTLASAARLRRQIEAEGMRVTMVTTYPDFTHPDRAQRLQELALEQEAIAIAAEVGAELVRVTAGQAHPETSIQAGVDWAIEGLTRLVETTQIIRRYAGIRKPCQAWRLVVHGFLPTSRNFLAHRCWNSSLRAEDQLRHRQRQRFCSRPGGLTASGAFACGQHPRLGHRLKRRAAPCVARYRRHALS